MISLTIAGAVSIETKPWTVDFMITVPRGTHMETAARRPSAEPVASTTNGHAATGSFLGTISVVTPGGLYQPHFVFVPAKKMHLRALRLQHLRDQQPELAIAQDGHPLALGDLHLIQNFARGRNRLDEDSVFGGNRRGNAMQVADRQRQEFSKRPRMLDDAQHGSRRAVTAQAALAPFAMSAGEIDLAHYPLPDPRFVGGLGHFAHEFVARRSGKSVVAALQFQVGGTDPGGQQANSCKTPIHAAKGGAEPHTARFEMNSKHRLKLRDMASATQTASAELVCFNQACRARYAITEVMYNCPQCGGLMEAAYGDPLADPKDLKKLFRDRRTSNAPLDQSGVWRYRELFPFLDDYRHVVTLREGNTPLLDGPIAAKYGGLDRITFKHQGFNPTGRSRTTG